jgi:WD40 repeat protein
MTNPWFRERTRICLVLTFIVIAAVGFYLSVGQRIANSAFKVQGHRSSVRSITFSHNGVLLASGSDDGATKVWDLGLKKEVIMLGGKGSTINQLAFSPDDHSLVIGAEDGIITVWDLSTRKELTSINIHNPLNCLLYAPDGKNLVLGGGKMINTGNGIVFPEPGCLVIWDVSRDSARLISRDRPVPVTALATTDDAQTMAVGFFDGVIQIWDTLQLKVEKSFEGAEGEIKWLSFVPAKKNQIICLSDSTGITLWDYENRISVRRITPQGKSVFYAASLSSDTKTLATCNRDNLIELWNVGAGSSIGRIRTCSILDVDPAYCLSFSPNNKQLAAGLFGGSVVVWDLIRNR